MHLISQSGESIEALHGAIGIGGNLRRWLRTTYGRSRLPYTNSNNATSWRIGISSKSSDSESMYLEVWCLECQGGLYSEKFSLQKLAKILNILINLV